LQTRKLGIQLIERDNMPKVPKREELTALVALAKIILEILYYCFFLIEKS